MSVPTSPAQWRPTPSAAVGRDRHEPPWRTVARPIQHRPRLRRLAVPIAIVFFVCLVLFLWVLTWLRPLRPMGLVLIGSDYALNLSLEPDVDGWRSLHDLAQLDRTSTLYQLRGGPSRLHKGDAWDRDLDRVAERTLVLMLHLHGGADPDGAYLLPEDASPDADPANRLRLSAILDRLARLPAHMNKVLIIDAVRERANIPYGILANDFARAALELDSRIAAVPNLVVLLTSGPDQRSWVIEDYHQTAFTHVLLSVLRNGPHDADSDGQLTALDVYHAVRLEVERWVWLNRGAVQTPMLLPTGSVGEQRARQVAFAPARDLTLPTPTDTEPFVLPSALPAAWKEANTMALAEPAPWVYTPGLWREYINMLMRYEKVLLAGDEPTASTLVEEMQRVRRQIEQRRELDLLSAERTLTMSAAAGLPPPDTTVSINDLWDADPATVAKRWQAQLAAASDRRRAATLRSQVGDAILRRALEDPVANLERAVRLARLLDAPNPVSSAELHFLLMLQRDLPTPLPPADLLTRAIRVRRLAERTALGLGGPGYPYSEAVYRWGKSHLLEADQARRRGEDLTFGSGTNWNDARTALAEAERLYQQAAVRTQAARTAITVRDTLFWQLPNLVHRIGRAPGDVDGQPGPAVIAEVVSLLRDLHALDAALSKADAVNTDPIALADQAVQLRRRLETLMQRSNEYLRQLADVDLASVWRQIDDVLLLPLVNYPDARMRLIQHQRRTSRKFLLETADGNESVDLPPTNRQTAESADQAQRRGRLSLELLGASLFNRLDTLANTKPSRPETAELVSHRLDTFAVEADGWKSLRVAGAEIGRRWAELPTAIAHLLQQANSEGVEQAQTDLLTAAGIARLIDAAGVQAMPQYPRFEYRRAQLHGFLMFMAQRTFDDHWAADSSDAEPFYRASGHDFLTDAETVLPGDPAVVKMHGRFDAPGTLTLTGPPRLALTTERETEPTFRIAPVAQAELPDGIAIVRATAGPGLSLTVSERAVAVGGEHGPADIPFALTSPRLLQAEASPPPTPEPWASSLQVNGLFRGQRLQRLTPAALYPTPTTTITAFPGPQLASLAVRADPAVAAQFGRGFGSVAIVLDCSGSMRPPEGEPFGPTTKFVEAVSAVREMLRQLPRGTQVSLWTFGQAMGVAKTVKDANRTVQQLLPPTTWDPDDAAQRAALMSRISYPALEPWNESPIVRTMLEAKQDLVRATGSRSLVVVTDGMDNQFESDTALNPTKQSIPDALRTAFADSGIAVDVIGFKIEDDEEKQARAQFSGITSYNVPGRFVTVDRVEDLITALQRALRSHVRYRIETEANVPVPGLGRGGQDASTDGNADQWFPPGLARGGYQLRLVSDPAISKDVVLHPADRLLARLVPTPRGGARFERVVWADDYPTRPWREVNGWRAAVLGERATDSGGISLLATLEKRPDFRETVLEEIRPRAVWWEMTPSTEGLAAVRWYSAAGYPAAATILESPLWPGEPPGSVGRPLLRVWWSPDQEFPPSGAFDRGADFQKLSDLSERTLVLEDDTVRLGTVAIEDHPVEVRPGVREERSCLVVRVHHSLGQPIWVAQRGLTPEGAEHRYFPEANASTSLFWPVTEATAKAGLQRLAFVSVKAFKQEATRRGFVAEFRDLGLPDPAGRLPSPPLPLP